MELLVLLALAIAGIVILIVVLFSVALCLGIIIGLWLYGPYYYDKSENNGWRASNWLRTHQFWNRLKRFYKHRIVQVGEPSEASQGALYACHPHGICALSVGLTFACSNPDYIPQKRVHIGVLSIIFKIPILRDVYLGLGCIHVDWKTMQSHIELGHATVLIPGGVNEMGRPIYDNRDERFLDRAFACQTQPSVSITTKIMKEWSTPVSTKGKKPKSYLKSFAVVTKVHKDPISFDIIPVYCHNEDDIYIIWQNEWRWVTWIRRKMAKYTGYPFPTGFIGPWPWKPLTTYIGPPHRLLPGDTLKSYKSRYWEALEALKLEAIKEH